MSDTNVDIPLGPATSDDVLATLPTPPSSSRWAVGQRTLKMIAARCDVCQSVKNAPRDWWKRCTHEKYITAVRKDVTRPKFEPDLDDEGQPTGRTKLVGNETLVEWVPMPNWKEVALSPRVNQGRGYQRNRRKGSILPEELRNAQWPNGGRPLCQYRGCFQVEGLVEYNVGVFHDIREAQLVWFDQEGKTLEYLHESDVESLTKREGMLDSAPIRAAV